MNAYILKCKPNSQFRLGRRSLDGTDEIIHSDTLFSAIINSCNLLYGYEQASEMVNWFKEDIAISSGFHCIAYQNDFVYFLPKPAMYEANSNIEIKKLKKIQFISIDVWQKGYQANDLKQLYVIGEKYVVSENDLATLRVYSNGKNEINLKLTSTNVYPKISIHQIGQENAYFTITSLRMNEVKTNEGKLQPHFYFMLNTEGLNNEQIKIINASIRLMADQGLGGERSTGNGAFEGVQEVKLNEINPQNANYNCALSLTVPANNTEFEHFHFYKLKMRGGGYVGKMGDTEQHRKQVRMIEEGALSSLSENIKGSIVNVTPEAITDNIILRNGKHFSIPVYLESNYSAH